MTDILRHPVIYANFELYNDGTAANADLDTRTIPAEITETYRRPLLARASDYVCAVERLEVNMNAIPHTSDASITAVRTADGLEYPLAPIAPFFVTVAYNITELVENVATTMNELQTFLNGLALEPAGPPGTVITVVLTAKGRVSINLVSVNNVTPWRFKFSDHLASKLGLTEHNYPIAPNVLWVSAFPVYDLGDEMHRLQLLSTLPATSDRQTETFTNILTDFVPGSPITEQVARGVGGALAFDTNTQAMAFSPRQKGIYIPTERRFINLRSGASVDSIRLWLQYVTPWGDSFTVPLVNGGIFSVKIGFWNKKGDDSNTDQAFQSFLSDRTGHVHFQ